MKSIKLLSFLLFFAAFGANASKTDSTNYFVGKWEVLIKGTPNGDAKMPMRIEMVDGKVKGFLREPEATEDKAMDSAEITGNDLNVAFNIMGYDVTMLLTKKDADVAEGKLMDMFECVATRVKN